MNNTTNSWEEKWNDYIDKRQEWFDFTSKANIAIELRDFVRTLIHDTEIAAREKGEKDGFIEGAESTKAKAKEIVEKISVMVCYECDGGKELREEILTALSQMDCAGNKKEV